MQALSELVSEHLQTEGYVFRRSPNTVEPEFETRIIAENCIADCRILVDDRKRRLQLSVSSGIRAPIDRSAQLQMFLFQMSFGRRRQVCRHSERTGEIALVSVAKLAHRELSRQEFVAFIGDAVARFDGCFPFLARIIYAGMDGGEAYRAYYSRNAGGSTIGQPDEINRVFEKLFEDYQPPDSET